MTPFRQSDYEGDRPPAGTPCCVCKAAGHFCQADQFTAGDSGNGICSACMEARDCPVLALRKGKSDYEVFDKRGRLDCPSSPVRSVPVPKAVSTPFEPAAVAAPKETKWGAIIARCLALKEGDSFEQLVLWDLDQDRFASQMRSTLHQHREAGYVQWSVQGIWRNHEKVEGIVQVSRGRDRRQRRGELYPPETVVMQRLSTVKETTETTITQTQTVREENSAQAEIVGLPLIEPPPLATKTKSVPAKTVPADLTLSHAFEMVIAEYAKGIEVMEDGVGEDDAAGSDSIKKMKEVVADLRESHPAVGGMTWTGGQESLYDRAAGQAKDELRVIELELARLGKRKKALSAILAALEQNQDAVWDTE